MFWIAMAVFLPWIGAGTFLLRRYTLKVGQAYRREVGRQVYGLGEEVEVALRPVPPIQKGVMEDRDVVLSLDHSGSMGAGPGSPLEEALRAAESFVQRCPPQVHVAVVSFDHGARLHCPLTGDHQRALRALAAVGPGGGTAIDQGLDRSREALAGGRAGVGKTVILLSDGGSDRKAAEMAAQRLRSDLAAPEVICVGLGPAAQEDLLVAVAGAPGHYCHVAEPDDLSDLSDLFGFLASAVSGGTAVAGRVDEGIRSPSPFHLVQTGGLHPVGVQQGESTRVIWSVPVLDTRPVALTYRLLPRCPGWHQVATDDSRVVWRMPDGSTQETPGPRGPRVLVLPDLLTWAWPVLNPLFWLLFGRFFCRAVPAHDELPLAPMSALPEPSFPRPLPEPEERPYQAVVRPALVIGLGEVGEWALCRLKHRLQDRGIEASIVEPLCITATHRANRVPAQVGGVELGAPDRIELHRDLRPYVETLRNVERVGSRSWIPWRSWLASTDPLATAHTLGGDRRKARLALLLGSSPVEDRLRAAVRRVLDLDGIVLIVAAAGDPEGSGLLAEVAHVCATCGGSVTAVLVRRRGDDLGVDGIVALGRELERMIALRGDLVLSDRREPPCEARKLFDRLLVLPPASPGPEAAAEGAAELAWSLLAYPEILRRMPTARLEGERVLCGEVEMASLPLPMLHLWNWVRDGTLAQVVNGHWLRLDVVDGTFRLPAVPKELAAGHATAFWNPVGFVRPQGRLSMQARAILQGQSPEATLRSLPVDALYPEQVAFSRGERRTFAAFCEEWCQRVLEKERENGEWGLPVLATALFQVERDLQSVLERIEQISGRDAARNLTRLATGLYSDLLGRVSGMRRRITPWIVALAGEQIDLGATSPVVRRPLCQDIEEGRRASEGALLLSNHAARRLIEQRFQQWLTEKGQTFQAQLGFRVSLAPDSLDPEIHLRIFDELLTNHDDLPSRLRRALDRYRNTVLTWPLEEGLEEVAAAETRGRLRFGRPSAKTFPRIREAVHEDDPYLSAMIGVRESPVAEALGIAGSTAADPQFAWPEESNARRMAERIRNSSLRREPAPFSAILVHLLRDPERLHAFLADLAYGRLDIQDGECRLLRNGHQLPVGKGSAGLTPVEALDNLESIARRVVVVRAALDGQPIPEAGEVWEASPEDALARVESHPLAKAAQGAPDWIAWRDLIQGLVLEVGHGRQAHQPPQGPK